METKYTEIGKKLDFIQSKIVVYKKLIIKDRLVEKSLIEFINEATEIIGNVNFPYFTIYEESEYEFGLVCTELDYFKMFSFGCSDSGLGCIDSHPECFIIFDDILSMVAIKVFKEILGKYKKWE